MLSYLCMMIDQVIADSGPFFCFYFLNLLWFSVVYETLNVDTSVYGRLIPQIGQFFNTFRSSIGEFGLLDPYQTFDTWN